MSDALTKVAALRAIHGDCILLKEGGTPVVLLQNFAFRAADNDVTMDLLLHPAPHSGYTTRLFFERQADLIAVHKEAANILPENQTAAKSGAPFHPGALKYFAEKGWKVQ